MFFYKIRDLLVIPICAPRGGESTILPLRAKIEPNGMLPEPYFLQGKTKILIILYEQVTTPLLHSVWPWPIKTLATTTPLTPGLRIPKGKL